MKKILSLALAALMLVSALPVAYAADTQDYSLGTAVFYNAEDPDGDGNKDNVEAYTVTVPAQLAPGESGNVIASGTWASNRKLTVSADANVVLTNSINAADTKTLDVSFAGIELAGSNTAAVSDAKAVSVADMPEDALFGTWSGTFNYQVDFIEAEPVELISFTIKCKCPENTNLCQAEKGMTWEQWAESDYNTIGIVVSGNPLCPNCNNWLLAVLNTDEIVEDQTYVFND